MPTRKRAKVHNKLYKQIWKLANAVFKRLIKWLLRSLLVIIKQFRRRRRLSRAGFVLPTVAMVSLVVVLLTTAILMRSFDRSRNASYVRVNETVLNAATPALDRARAKIDTLLTDPALPRTTPSDLALYNVLTSDRYKLGDETRLKLVSNFGNGTGGSANGTIESRSAGTASKLENDETLTTAWKFPVDTDNNGKFDSYTLYSIHFRSPSRGTDGKFNRARNPLEARTPPMRGGTIGSQCADVSGTSDSLVGDSDWYRTGAKLTKSFFVYTATVPIINAPAGNTNYDAYKGVKGFSALELQQDRSRIPLVNKAVLFQDDLELTPSNTFRLNGSIATNANLLIGGHNNAAISIYQVSSKNSCFYKEENSKITVGGNVGTGNVTDSADKAAVTVDLFNGFGNAPGSGTINSDNRSTTSAGGAQVGYNDAAYNQRIALMKQKALSYSTTNPPTVTSVDGVSQYPQEIKDGFRRNITAPGGSSLNAQDVLAAQIEIYLKDRTRRVPYAEVAFGANALGTYNSTNVFTSGTIDPPDAWNLITNTNPLTLNTDKLPQTQPEKQREEGKETNLGDRVFVGNNLPAFWKKDGKYVTGPNEKQLLGSTIKWTSPNTQERYRTTQVTPLLDVGMSNRNGFWEDAAAQPVSSTVSNTSGLRVITGAGIYVDDDGSATVGTPSYSRSTSSFLPKPTLDSGVSNPNVFTTSSITSGNENIVVWPDSMPMTGGSGETRKSDLQMRATAVYHYKDSSYTETNYINRTPTACVSSYYDPTNANTAKNSILSLYNYATTGRSNNGIVYPAPYTTDSGRNTAVSTYRTQLNRQARLVFPNGRIVNQPLRDALKKIDASGTRSLADNSALDTAICAIKILSDATFLPNPTPPLPHGAIKEASFLDAREVKATDKNTTTTAYDLELEQRQPLEVRVTDIDLNQLRGQTIGSALLQEYMLPNSGIIYANRDGALLDLSDTNALLSPTDFKLDITRRPNGIRLINGSNLERNDNFRVEEKGLILATNLPAYIRGNFNLHQKSGTSTATEEFTDHLASDWNNFYTRTATLDNNFACRKGQPGCGSNGDQWRPATIISDAITLLSNSFEDGFRNQGDYDIRNNAGSYATSSRNKNGFFDNSFVTSANWAGSDGFPSSKNSYLTNGITPIQRRANFPEYVMEICRKIPVSSCQPNDWVVGFDQDGFGTLSDIELNLKASQAIGFPGGVLVSGTTARRAGNLIQAAVPAVSSLIPPTRLEDQRYARRIAFKRKSNGTLELKDWNGEPTPIPLGINSLTGLVDEFPYDTYGTTVGKKAPKSADNALWFRTTSNTSGRPFCNGNNNPAGSGCTSDDRSYASDKPLYYDGSTKLASPPTPEIPGVDSLNLPAANPASGYTICTKNEGSTKKSSAVSTTTLEGGKCADEPGNPLAAIEATLEDLLALNPTSSATDEIVTPLKVGTLDAGKTTTYTETGRVNVIDLGSSNLTLGTSDTASTTIKLVGNADSVFVFKKSSGSLDFASNSSCGKTCIRRGVVIELDGVDPNNVFWALDSNPQWNEVNSSYPHEMKGTFISKGTAAPSLRNVNIEGRLLGVNGLPVSGSFSGGKIYAIASNGQPSLVPVLQIHSPEGSPGSTLAQGSADIQAKWLQASANDTTVNAVFVSGNSPSRPAEGSAGLHNFVRLIENWSSRTLNIKGSFIQLKRSAYATAPFATVLTDKSDDNNGSLSIFGYIFTQYKTDNGEPSGTLPYYKPPARQWGFDVGILSQTPDLFAQKFTLQPVAPPDEFFREVGRGESWIQPLLCAAQGSGTNYAYAIDSSERPTTCPALTSYNDS